MVLDPIPSGEYNPTAGQNLNGVQPRAQLRNDPQGLRGTPVDSSVGVLSPQEVFRIKKALYANRPNLVFSQLANAVIMPRNKGQKIVQTVQVPLLDDRNLNDQGINARGVQIRNGNLYGSSRDIGRIQGALPLIPETGGRVNRVGFTRLQMSGTFNQFGMFLEYTRDLENFDSDPNLIQAMYDEIIRGAQQISEDALQVDLLNGAGINIYAGNAVNNSSMDHTSIVTLSALKRLQKALDDTRTPRNTKIISGSDKVDTRTASIYRTLFVGQEVLQILENIVHPVTKELEFIHVHQYKASDAKLFENEVGIIANFRVVLVDNMVLWEGEGATADPQYGLGEANGKYNIYPMLCVGEDSFTSISFLGSNGLKNKFNIHHQPPEKSYTAYDPYGTTGFISIQWYYGILITRPERIGLIKTVAFN